MTSPRRSDQGGGSLVLNHDHGFKGESIEATSYLRREGDGLVDEKPRHDTPVKKKTTDASSSGHDAVITDSSRTPGGGSVEEQHDSSVLPKLTKRAAMVAARKDESHTLVRQTPVNEEEEESGSTNRPRAGAPADAEGHFASQQSVSILANQYEKGAASGRKRLSRMLEKLSGNTEGMEQAVKVAESVSQDCCVT